jgi:hypothetical protein
MLTMALELLSILTQQLLELNRPHYWVILVPHLIEELSIGLSESAFCAEGVLGV